MRKKNINIHTYEFPSLIIFCLHSWLTCSNSAAFWIRHQTRQVVCYLWQGFQILSSQLTQKSLAMLNVVWCRPGLFACHHVSVERSIMKINLKDDHRNGCLCFFGFYLLCCDSVLPVYLFPNHWLFFFHFQQVEWHLTQAVSQFREQWIFINSTAVGVGTILLQFLPLRG